VSVPFVPALQLSGGFYRDVVRPLLGREPHAAALLGWGSDVLGYDTARSTDHGWGPRLQVFVDAGADELAAMLDVRLPETYQGWPVRFGWDDVPVRHWVSVGTLRDWLLAHLGVDATAGFGTLDWLVTPQQRLLGVVAGAVYADEAGVLGPLRQRLAWYPDQVWRWLLACQWHRVAQEEAFVARTAEVGDAIGSRVTVARQVRELMRLALLLERRYTPYQKWLGTAFARLPHDDGLPAQLDRALSGDALAAAYGTLARRHNRAGITDPLPATTGPYHSRPAAVLMADRFTAACLATVTDPALRALPLIGAIDQHTDSTDVLSDPRLFRRTAALYDVC
jgi:hypothetical protein